MDEEETQEGESEEQMTEKRKQRDNRSTEEDDGMVKSFKSETCFFFFLKSKSGFEQNHRLKIIKALVRTALVGGYRRKTAVDSL